MNKVILIKFLLTISFFTEISALTTKEICKDKIYETYSTEAYRRFKEICNVPPYKSFTLKEYDDFYKEFAEMTLLCLHEINTTDSTKGEGCTLRTSIEHRGWVSGLIPWELENKPELSADAKANKEIAYDIDTTFQITVIQEKEKLNAKKAEYNALPFYKRWITTNPSNPEFYD